MTSSKEEEIEERKHYDDRVPLFSHPSGFIRCARNAKRPLLYSRATRRTIRVRMKRAAILFGQGTGRVKAADGRRRPRKKERGNPDKMARNDSPGEWVTMRNFCRHLLLGTVPFSFTFQVSASPSAAECSALSPSSGRRRD